MSFPSLENTVINHKRIKAQTVQTQCLSEGDDVFGKRVELLIGMKLCAEGDK